jgi:hypothetical protein
MYWAEIFPPNTPKMTIGQKVFRSIISWVLSFEIETGNFYG